MQSAVKTVVLVNALCSVDGRAQTNSFDWSLCTENKGQAVSPNEKPGVDFGEIYGTTFELGFM